jgi:hypothetical protein
MMATRAHVATAPLYNLHNGETDRLRHVAPRCCERCSYQTRKCDVERKSKLAYLNAIGYCSYLAGDLISWFGNAMTRLESVVSIANLQRDFAASWIFIQHRVARMRRQTASMNETRVAFGGSLMLQNYEAL